MQSWRAAALLAALSAFQAERTKCASIFGGGDVTDRTGELPACSAHERRTCCDRGNVSRVHFDHLAYRKLEPSAKCLEQWKSAACAHCDGDVGAGLKLSGGLVALCAATCAAWYSACEGDFFASDSMTGGVRLCLASDILCSRLGEMVASPTEFCQRSGFSEAELCFDGTPAAAKKPPGRKVAKPKQKPGQWRQERGIFERLRDDFWAKMAAWSRKPPSVGTLIAVLVLGQLFVLMLYSFLRSVGLPSLRRKGNESDVCPQPARGSPGGGKTGKSKDVGLALD